MQQYDIVPGLDLSQLSSASLAQITQAIAQLSPLINIGGIVYGSTAPDIANNPRFARYLWIDTSTITPTVAATIKTYNPDTGSWFPIGVTASSVGNVELAPHVKALDHMFNPLLNGVTPDPTVANALLVYDSAGAFITQINRDAFLGSVTINLSQISTAGASSTNSYLRFTQNGIEWSSIDFDLIDDGSIQAAKLEGGPPNWLLRSTRDFAAEWVNNNDAVGNFLPPGSTVGGINVSKLMFPANSASKILKINAAGNALEWADAATVPSMVEYSAKVYLSTPQVITNNGRIQYNDSEFNNNVTYDLVTHRFTVPKSGRYLVHAVAYTPSVNGFYINIFAENQAIATSVGGLGDLNVEANALVSLEAGTHLYVEANGAGSFTLSAVSYQNHFSIIKLSP